MLCPTCAKVNESSALECSLCGSPFPAAGRGQAPRAATDPSDRRRTAPGMSGGSGAAPPFASPPPAAPPEGGRKVPTLQGVRAPALEARSANKVRTVIGVAMPGPGNDLPAGSPAPGSHPPHPSHPSQPAPHAHPSQQPRSPHPSSPSHPSHPAHPSQSAHPAHSSHPPHHGAEHQAPALPRALTPDALPASPRHVLCELMRRHGEEIMTDPRRCGSLLAADYHRQVSYLVAALEERIPQRLVVESTSAPIEAVVRAMADELGRRRELPITSALYAVESWAIALGLIAPRSPAAGA